MSCASSPGERRAAIYDLQANPTEENIAQLRGLLDDADRDVRATALNVLFGLEVPDAERLALERLDDEDGFVRATAAKLVGEHGNLRHAPALVRVLASDSDPVARQRAAEGLGSLGGPEALAGLASGLEDPMDRVRLACVDGLRALDPPFARAALTRLLREDPVWEIRVRAARTLGLAGGPEAVPTLEAALEDPNEFVRAAAANALDTLEVER